MFEAIHKKTFDETGDNIKSGYFAWEIWNKFIDPHKEEWLCCPICKKEVVPVIQHMRNNTDVCTHFRIKNEDLGDCKYGESDEHRHCKLLIAELMENHEITLIINGQKTPTTIFEYEDMKRLPFRWEVNMGNRRADVLFELKKSNSELGRGIVFEIQKSYITKEDMEAREEDWFEKGYSFTWLYMSDFKDGSLINNTIDIKKVWSQVIEYKTYLINDTEKQTNQRWSEMQNQIEQRFTDMKRLEDIFRQKLKNEYLDLKNKQVFYNNINKSMSDKLKELETKTKPTCKTCKYGSPSRYDYKHKTSCWWDTVNYFGKRLDPRELDNEDACDGYESHTKT